MWIIDFRQGLNRQVILGETATYSIPELEFEVPEKGEKGLFTTIEVLFFEMLVRIIKFLGTCRSSDWRPFGSATTKEGGLFHGQHLTFSHMIQLIDPEVHDKIQAFIGRLQSLLDGTTPFTFILSDPSGNSHIENKFAPNPDPGLIDFIL